MRKTGDGIGRQTISSTGLPIGCKFLLLSAIVSLLLLISGAADAKLQSDHGSFPVRARQSDDQEADVYTFDKVWDLLYQDMSRWLAVAEDILAENIRAHFFDGLVDRKTIKMGLRYFTQNMFISLRESGYFVSSQLPPITSV